MNPKKRMDDYEKILNAVKKLPPNTEFGGITVAQFETQVELSRDKRVVVAEKANEKIAAEDDRDDTDQATTQMRNVFVNGVKGHKDHGEDSPLWEQMGFVRKSERKSGLTRKTKADGK